MIFKRKLYDKLRQWKQKDDGHSAILIKGARRVGKSTVAEEFAKNEYETYIVQAWLCTKITKDTKCLSAIRDCL